MERDVNLFIALILQCIILSSANQNLVPVFVSEMGRSSFKGNRLLRNMTYEEMLVGVRVTLRLGNSKRKSFSKYFVMIMSTRFFVELAGILRREGTGVGKTGGGGGGV